MYLLFETPVIRKKDKWGMYMGGILILVDGQGAVARPLDRIVASRELGGLGGKGDGTLNTRFFFAQELLKYTDALPI